MEEEQHQQDTDQEDDDQEIDLNMLSNTINDVLNSRAESSNEEEHQSKSIFQTFMDVNSIFSRNFGEKLPQKTTSRFVAEELEEGSQEDEADNFEGLKVEGKNSIFSSSNLFQNRQQALPQPFAATEAQNPGETHRQSELPNQLYQMLSQNFMQSQVGQGQQSQFASGQSLLSAGPSQSNQAMDSSAHELDSVYTSAVANNSLGGDMYQGPERQLQPPGPGLSSSSFANLRKRALDVDVHALGKEARS